MVRSTGFGSLTSPGRSFGETGTPTGGLRRRWEDFR